ncbi:MAG: Ni/Fe hydrogenase subunit alpha [Deltaproteobacteria bacterium]|nr:Ni/Fe hydrogenase subunit alpha [Deltaproteobacteria bacterium]
MSHGGNGHKVINIQPVTRIEGHARITIMLDDAGNVADARLNIMSLRGFEKFIEGKPAEEVPRIVSRICGICPWMHHTASNKAVDGCFHAEVPPAAHKLRELMQVMAQINDKILHFFFLAAPDFVMGSGADYSVRNVMGIVKAAPDLARKVVKMRQAGQMMLESFAGRAIHPVVVVPGGFAKPMGEEERQGLLKAAREQLEFARYAIDFSKREIFQRMEPATADLGRITTGFLGTVKPEDGSLTLYDGVLRLMKADGSYQDFPYDEYVEILGEHVEDWSTSKFPYARSWNEGFSMDLGDPRGIYRVNTLARLNVCDRIETPLAQAELEEFRSRFGRPAQSTMLYHWARLIELVYACERVIQLLEDPEITDLHVRNEVLPRAGRGIGCVEAPRGTLIHDYSTDDNGLILRANLVVGTTHNVAPMNMSVQQAARSVISRGRVSEEALNKVEMALRCYDP